MAMFEYLKSPNYSVVNSLSYKEKIQSTFLMYLKYLITVLLIFGILKIVDSFLIEYFFGTSIVDQLKLNQNNLKEKFGKYTFLVVVLIGPLMEEILFRLPLGLKKSGIALACAVLSYRLLSKHFFVFEYTNPYAYVSIALALLTFLLVTKFLPDSWLTFLKRRYAYFFYFFAISFALIHVTNFAPYDERLILFYPLFTLPQFVMALFIGYTRIKYGFVWGIILHSMINLPAIFLMK